MWSGSVITWYKIHHHITAPRISALATVKREGAAGGSLYTHLFSRKKNEVGGLVTTIYIIYSDTLLKLDNIQVSCLAFLYSFIM